jgi:hypothetical protein
MSAPWLTDADRAEWDLLWRVLVDEVFDHRERGCDRCADGSCPAVRGAIEAVVEWAELRSLRSFAVAMRARQDVIDARGSGVSTHSHGSTNDASVWRRPRVLRLGQAGREGQR